MLPLIRGAECAVNSIGPRNRFLDSDDSPVEDAILYRSAQERGYAKWSKDERVWPLEPRNLEVPR